MTPEETVMILREHNFDLEALCKTISDLRSDIDEKDSEIEELEEKIAKSNNE